MIQRSDRPALPSDAARHHRQEHRARIDRLCLRFSARSAKPSLAVSGAALAAWLGASALWPPVTSTVDAVLVGLGSSWRYLDDGSNQGHTSSDISFDLERTADDGALGVTRGPYLQLGTADSIVVRWRTNQPADSEVRYGPAPDSLIWTATNAAVTTEHLVQLDSLQADTTYYYSVGTSTTPAFTGDPTYVFTTAPLPGTAKPTRVWVLGDSGTADANAAAVRDAYAAFTGTRGTDILLMLGDNAYDDGTDSEYQAAVFDRYPSVLRQTVAWPTLGNHDGRTADSTSQSGPYYDMFTLPTLGEAGGLASGTEAYYSFDFGNIHFVCLDSFDTDRSPGSAMLTWLQADLATTTQPWIIAYWHHPAYSKGSHDSDTESALVEMRTNVLPILEAGGVDLVLAGHSHSYERSFLLDGHYGTSDTLGPDMIVDAGDGRENGTGAYQKPSVGPAQHAGAVYAVAGSSGKISSAPLDHPAMGISLLSLGSMVLDIDGHRLDATFLDETGAVRDDFTVLKGAWPDANQAPELAVPPDQTITLPTASASVTISPTASTSSTAGDADDPAIWIHPTDPARSLVFGSDKSEGVYVFDLSGAQLQHLPQGTSLNNIDVRAGFTLGGQAVDILAGNLRDTGKLAVFVINPDYAGSDVLTQIAGQDSVDNDIQADSYGFTLYRRPSDGTVYVFERPKLGGTLRQYRIEDDGTGAGIRVVPVRDLTYSGGTAEGFVADDQLGHLYVAEEDFGVHKYLADPTASPAPTALFATLGGPDATVPDLEGAALYTCDDGSGYFVLSVQGANRYNVYRREGDNAFVTTVLPLDELGNQDLGTDGLDVSAVSLPGFPAGLLVGHDQGGARYHLYQWSPIASGCTGAPPGNRAPVFDAALPDQTDAEGAAVALALPVGATDPDGDGVTYAATGLPPALSMAADGTVTGTVGASAAGVYAVTVTATDDGTPPLTDTAAFTWTITDAGVPDISPDPTEYDFGTVLVGPGPGQLFTIRNDGTGDLDVTAATLAGADPGEFTIDSAGAPALLAPGDALAIAVRFNPTSPGAKSALLQVGSDDPDENPLDLALTGTGAAPGGGGGGPVLLEETQSGGATGVETVTTAPLGAAPGDVFLAALASKPFVAVTQMSGLGLTWTPLAAMCGARLQTGVSVWMAQGVTPGGPVTATLASAPQNAVLTVARYSGEHSTDPVALLGAANTNGLDGSCSGGSDGTAYTLPVATTVPGAVVFGAAAMRHRLHDPAAGFTAYGEVVQGSGGSAASVEVFDQTLATPIALDLAGTFSSSVDWAVIGVEIRPGAAGQ